MYIHGSTGSDILLFASWTPSSAGAYVGCCIGLFVIAMGYRLLIVVKRGAEGYWRRE
jgi:hypothetical protein